MAPYFSPLDPHVHLRGSEYKTDFLRISLKHAAASGLCAVLEQPNPVPQLTSVEVITDRNRKVNQILLEEHLKLQHHCHIGLTIDPDQIRRAFIAAKSGTQGIKAVKAFWVHSTGNMGIIDAEVQKKVWELATETGYQGPIIQHCEDEQLFLEAFDPSNPITHSIRQSPMAETVQVERQLKNAYDARFGGIFYVAHVSNPSTVDLIQQFKDSHSDHPMTIVMEACWHHLLLNTDDYAQQGNNVKMNPPLRSKALQERLLEHLLAGHIQVLGTDHAPHEPKDPLKPASGVPGIPFWPKGIEILHKLGMTTRAIEDISFNNANFVFSLGLSPQETTATYHPEFWEAYGFNPFSRVDTAY